MRRSPIRSPDRDRAAESTVAGFARWLSAEKGVNLADPLDYQALWSWSVESTEEFWAAVWDFFGVKVHSRARVAVLDSAVMPGARWFEGATLNYVEHAIGEGEPGLPVH